VKKPQPWYAKLNPPAWSPKNGRNRKPHPPTHRDPTDRTSDSTGAPDAADAFTYSILPGGITYIQPGGVTYIYPFPKPPAHPAIPYAGVRAGEITGHRMWYVLNNLQLCSIAHHFIWEPNATIHGDVDKIVDDSYGSFTYSIYGGTYSYNDRGDIYEYGGLTRINPDEFPMLIHFDYYRGSCTIHGIAIGTIKCWGEVVEHEKGYRAQYAKLTSITDVIGSVDINELRQRYKV
jgi:hypothetical protein